MARVSQQVLADWPNERVKPDQPCPFSTIRLGKMPEGPNQLRATIRWRPGKDDIVADIDVVDANFSINPDQLHMGSSIGLYFSASGFDDTRVYCVFAPSGPEDAPLMKNTGCGPMKATWQRTDTGYRMNVTIPYTSIQGLEKGWKFLPVDAMVNTMTPDGRCALVVGEGGQPWQGSQTYVELLRK